MRRKVGLWLPLVTRDLTGPQMTRGRTAIHGAAATATVERLSGGKLRRHLRRGGHPLTQMTVADLLLALFVDLFHRTVVLNAVGIQFMDFHNPLQT